MSDLTRQLLPVGAFVLGWALYEIGAELSCRRRIRQINAAARRSERR